MERYVHELTGGDSLKLVFSCDVCQDIMTYGIDEEEVELNNLPDWYSSMPCLECHKKGRFNTLMHAEVFPNPFRFTKKALERLKD